MYKNKYLILEKMNHVTHSIFDNILLIFQDRVPFAVIGSNKVIESGGKKIRGRQYPWGIVEG
jgi:septin family protein